MITIEIRESSVVKMIMTMETDDDDAQIKREVVGDFSSAKLFLGS